MAESPRSTSQLTLAIRQSRGERWAEAHWSLGDCFDTASRWVYPSGIRLANQRRMESKSERHETP